MTKREEMEHILDQRGILKILDDLVEICYEKQEHVSAEWQDDKLAAAWAKAARIIDTARERIQSKVGDLP